MSPSSSDVASVVGSDDEVMHAFMPGCRVIMFGGGGSSKSGASDGKGAWREPDQGYLGTVKYQGPVEGQGGVWLGIQWDNPERGKHDGCHLGKSYFNVTIKKSGSFVRLPSDAKDLKYLRDTSGPRGILDAVQEKYMGDSIDATDGKGEVYWGGKMVEKVGFEKIERKQKRLANLREIALDRMRVALAGVPPMKLSQTLASVVELDLSRNLFRRFDDVIPIISALKSLDILRLSGNRFERIEKSCISWRDSVSHVKTLSLHETLMSLKEICYIAEAFSELEELHIGFNQIDLTSNLIDGQEETSEKAIALKIGAIFPKLQLLNLESNVITSWTVIERCFGAVANLHTLILSNNPLTTISPHKSGIFPKLACLHLHNCALAEWECLDAIDSYETLTSLRLKSNPLFQDMARDAVYIHIVARLGHLKSLNGGEINEFQRKDAERYYLNLCEAENVKRATATETDTTVAPGSTMFLDRKHPRYASLVEKHGAPLPSKPNKTSTALAHSILQLTFVYDARNLTIKKKLPDHLTVRKLKIVLQRLCKLEEARMKLSFTQSESGHVITLDDDLRTLSYYGLSDAETIMITEMDVY